MIDNMTTVLERGDTIYFDKTLIKNIDFFINPRKFGYFMYYKGTQRTYMVIFKQSTLVDS